MYKYIYIHTFNGIPGSRSRECRNNDVVSYFYCIISLFRSLFFLNSGASVMAKRQRFLV